MEKAKDRYHNRGKEVAAIYYFGNKRGGGGGGGGGKGCKKMQEISIEIFQKKNKKQKENNKEIDII